MAIVGWRVPEQISAQLIAVQVLVFQLPNFGLLFPGIASGGTCTSPEPATNHRANQLTVCASWNVACSSPFSRYSSDFIKTKVGLGQVAGPTGGFAKHDNPRDLLELELARKPCKKRLGNKSWGPGACRTTQKPQSRYSFAKCLDSESCGARSPSQGTRSGKRRFRTGASLRVGCGKGMQRKNEPGTVRKG